MATQLEYVIKTSDGKQLVECPVSWHGVSTAKYQEVIEKWKADGSVESLVQLFSIFTSIDLNQLMLSTDNGLEDKIYKAVKFVFDPLWDFNMLAMPTALKFKDQLFIIPTNLGSLSLGQSLLVRKLFSKGEDLRKHISFAIAVYMQPIIDNAPLSLDRVNEIEKEIKAMCIVDTYPVGIFFLKQLNKSGVQHSRLWNQTRRIIQSMPSVWRLVRWLRLNCLRPIKILTTLKNTL